MPRQAIKCTTHGKHFYILCKILDNVNETNPAPGSNPAATIAIRNPFVGAGRHLTSFFPHPACWLFLMQVAMQAARYRK
jgi:hypothetical protein